MAKDPLTFPNMAAKLSKHTAEKTPMTPLPQPNRRRSAMMLRVSVLAMMTWVARGSRPWEALIDPAAYQLPDPGLTVIALSEGDPHLTRSTFRPTSSPTVTARPTSYPTYPFPTISPSESPSTAPSISASKAPSVSTNPTISQSPTVSLYPTITAAPTTKEPTWAPGTGPTAQPSSRTEHEDGNGGCPAGDTLHEVILFDKWGDGWEGRVLTIERLGDGTSITDVVTDKVDETHYVLTRSTVFLDGASTTQIVRFNNQTLPAKEDVIMEESTPGMPLSENPVFREGLTTGDAQIRYACLQQGRCFRATIEGGAWAEEISWEIRQAALGAADVNITINHDPIVNGGAPSNCTFSVLRENETAADMVCPSQCHLAGEAPLLTLPPSPAPVLSASLPLTPGLTDFNSPSVSEPPSISPSLSSAPSTSSPSISPSSLPSLIPSDLPSLEPTIPETGSPTAPSSDTPSLTPTSSPTLIPSSEPSLAPSTVSPTAAPSGQPTARPTSSAPTPDPTPSPPTSEPTWSPTLKPSVNLNEDPTWEPTWEPTWSPTTSPTTVADGRHGVTRDQDSGGSIQTDDGGTSDGTASSNGGQPGYFDDFINDAGGRHNDNAEGRHDGGGRHDDDPRGRRV